MSEKKQQAPEKELKRRFQLWLRPSVLDMAEELYECDNCISKSEFIEKAIQFYAGYLYSKQSQDYLPKIVTSTIKGITAENTNQICRILFKLAVELSITMNVVAASWNVCIPGKEDQWILFVHGCLRSAKAVNNAEISNEIQVYEARCRRQAYGRVCQVYCHP